ncbi:hypothetical protein PIB30_078993 [Stylosanthes scabra]|uniref:Uncharacterized protein n=1 Tax=Stylosanthes scabra TaxID=79078 RepID=A0ABU6SS84_9FABA|nr:hypothetical protein [Stylosanthes scabra]
MKTTKLLLTVSNPLWRRKRRKEILLGSEIFISILNLLGHFQGLSWDMRIQFGTLLVDLGFITLPKHNKVALLGLEYIIGCKEKKIRYASCFYFLKNFITFSKDSF